MSYGVKPNEYPYTFDSIGIMEEDSENGELSTEAQFEAGADIDEGVSGRKRIDTTYENYSEDIVNPRSEDSPLPMDLHRYPHRRT